MIEESDHIIRQHWGAISRKCSGESRLARSRKAGERNRMLSNGNGARVQAGYSSQAQYESHDWPKQIGARIGKRIVVRPIGAYFLTVTPDRKSHAVAVIENEPVRMRL